MEGVFITNHSIYSSLGDTSAANYAKLYQGESALALNTFGKEKYWSSLIDKNELQNKFMPLASPSKYTYLEMMMILAIQEVLDASKKSISSKTGVIIATTKGNVEVLDKSSAFYNSPERAYLNVLGKTIQTFFKIKHEPIILSNACVSGSLALLVAKRLLESNQYDDILVVSGDRITNFIMSGFASFQAVSPVPCKPFSKHRVGVSLGEAAAVAWVSKNSNNASAQILSGSSCNDANHISGPSRTGEGLFRSIVNASAQLQHKVEFDFISAHGTATPYNDEMEAIAFNRLGLENVPLHSLKGYYGHTLGASGLLETLIGIECMNHNNCVASKGFDELGVSKPLNVLKENFAKPIQTFLKTASGFGGCNTALIIKKVIA